MTSNDRAPQTDIDRANASHNAVRVGDLETAISNAMDMLDAVMALRNVAHDTAADVLTQHVLEMLRKA